RVGAPEGAAVSVPSSPPVPDNAEATGGHAGIDPGDDIAGELQDLVDGRARAWRSGDPALLDRVLALGSPALDSEVAALAGAQDQGLRYPDVSFRVEDATVVREEDGR